MPHRKCACAKISISVNSKITVKIYSMCRHMNKSAVEVIYPLFSSTIFFIKDANYHMQDISTGNWYRTKFIDKRLASLVMYAHVLEHVTMSILSQNIKKSM